MCCHVVSLESKDNTEIDMSYFIRIHFKLKIKKISFTRAPPSKGSGALLSGETNEEELPIGETIQNLQIMCRNHVFFTFF